MPPSNRESPLKRCPSQNRHRKTASTAAVVFAAVLVCILAPKVTPAQALRKDANITSPASSGNQQASSAKKVFQQNCASCHYAETTAQKIGPGLKGLFARGTFADGKRVTDAGLTKWIEGGGRNMPGLKDSMKSEEIRAVISYIKTL